MRARLRAGVVVAAGACLAAGLLPAGAASARSAAATERVSAAADGAQSAGFAASPALSADGRYAAFTSDAADLGPSDTNGQQDVYLKDLRTGKVELVSVGSDGTQGDALSGSPAISADGRYVAFSSSAGNLVPGDTNKEGDVFVRDRVTGRTQSPTAGAGTSPYGYGVQGFAISGDGRYLAFGSSRADLVPGDTNESQDVFVADLRERTTRRVSVASDGSQAEGASRIPTISADGRRVGFVSRASNLPGARTALRPPPLDPMYVHDLGSGRTRAASLSTAGAAVGVTPSTSLSPDGRYALFVSPAGDVVPGDTNGTYDIFARDLNGDGGTRLLTRAHDGAQGNGWASDGRLSADNRRLFFTSVATNLVPGDTNGYADGFVRDLRTGAVQRVNLAADGAQSTSWTNAVVPDASGRTALFDSRDEGLVPGDTNASGDVFVRRLQNRPVGGESR